MLGMHAPGVKLQLGFGSLDGGKLASPQQYAVAQRVPQDRPPAATA